MMAFIKKFRARLHWPKINIDLSKPIHRLKFTLTIFAVLIIAIGLLIGGIKTYDYTESSEFCGTVCHVMDPQYIRFEASPHSNVDCAQCHIGPGASFFVRSKIDGLRQVYATIFNTYSHPIKSPVKNLRPARETCETCHSPTTFKDNIVKTIQHYDDDVANTPIQTTLILKMGGWQESTGIIQGIHWHISSEIYYIAEDDQRQSILWVAVRQPDGTLKEYFSRELGNQDQAAFVEQARQDGKLRQMDCIDCHNRTAHYIPYPEQAVDQAISTGMISRSIPSIRTRSVELLKKTYASKEEAYSTFEKLAGEYSMDMPGKLAYDPALSQVNTQLVSEAIETLKKLYDQDTFLEMNTDWVTNPNNEKHTPTLGCFRCHNDSFVSIEPQDGKQAEINSDCNLCHTVPITGRGSEVLIEAPVIVGVAPVSHNDYSWTIMHRTTTDIQKQDCFQCHGQGFCNNSACHNLSHPENMRFTHAEEFKKTGAQACYTCHQQNTCARCHEDPTCVRCHQNLDFNSVEVETKP
jgi:nitrate/TMAO reductase-like tetraheme cytochrome c subunit